MYVKRFVAEIKVRYFVSFRFIVLEVTTWLHGEIVCFFPKKSEKNKAFYIHRQLNV